MEPWCMYFAGEYVQYHRRVRKDTGAQANYFVGVVKEDSGNYGDVLVKAYLSKYAKTSVTEFTTRLSLCDPEPNFKRKLRKGDMFCIDGGDPNFHGFQMKIDAKDGKHLVTVNVPFLYGEGGLPTEFFGYSHLENTEGGTPPSRKLRRTNERLTRVPKLLHEPSEEIQRLDWPSC